MSFSHFLTRLGAAPAVQVPALEEQEEEPITELSAKDTLHIDDIDIDLNKDAEYPLFFVDGAERIAITHYIRVPGYPRIPIVGAHIVVGAGELRNEKIFFKACREIFVVIFPYQAIINVLIASGASIPTGEPGQFMDKLDWSGDFYVKASQQKMPYPIPTFFCDSTLDFQGNVSLRESDLIASGNVIRVAKNRVDGIRRALEVGLVMELRKEAERHEKYIIVDGPLANKPFLMYGHLADKQLRQDFSTPQTEFTLLRRLIGVVKIVEVVPQEGLASVFQHNFRVSVHKFKDSDIGWHFLACFTILRPELTSLIRGAPQIAGGLVRIDVPLPAVMDSYDPNWPDIGFTTINKDKLERLLRGILKLRTPPPHDVSSYRFLTELYPIHEVENYLHSRLFSKEQ
ncbi:MAG: hypothetical protein QXN21_06880, partial [Candidatus Bathyarchaeia archaeon]